MGRHRAVATASTACALLVLATRTRRVLTWELGQYGPPRLPGPLRRWHTGVLEVAGRPAWTGECESPAMDVWAIKTRATLSCRLLCHRFPDARSSTPSLTSGWCDAAKPSGRGPWVDLNPPDSVWSEARAVNASGTVAGNFRRGCIERDIELMVSFCSGADAIDLNRVMQATWSSAEDINDAGQVVGAAVFDASADPAHAHALRIRSRVRWPGVGLGTLSGTSASFALAINNHGQVVGWSGDNTIGSPTCGCRPPLPRRQGSNERAARTA